MTLQHLFRTAPVAFICAATIAAASPARAEGGEGASIVPPDKYAAIEEPAVAAAGDPAPAPADDADVPPATGSLPALGKLKGQAADAVRAKALRPLIARYASAHDLPFALADAVVRIESRYNAAARNGPNLGLTQINLRTAQSLGYRGGAAGLLDAETNLRYGLQYLGEVYRLAAGDLCGAVLRYQFGHRAQTMTRASRSYCARVKVITAKAE